MGETVTGNAENGHAGRGSRDAIKKLKVHTLLSVLTIVIGVVGAIVVGYVEDDPIVIPPLLVALGIVWLIITRIRVRPHHK